MMKNKTYFKNKMSLSIVLLYYKAEFLGQYSEQGPKNLGIKWPKNCKPNIANCFN